MRKPTFFLLGLMSLLSFPLFAAHAERGLRVIDVLTHANGKAGAFWALLIGIDEYEDKTIPDLETAAADAMAMAKLLRKRYGFKIDADKNILLNRSATKEAIYNALRSLASTARPSDSVLIYYAGHGELDRLYDDGWWIPTDAKAGDPLTYLGNGEVQKAMRRMQAQHVLLISDSCYSGSLFGKSRSLSAVITDNYYLGLFKEKSRWGMTSGNKTPVSDSGTDGHSVFAYQLLKELRENKRPYLTTQELCTRIAPIISNNSESEQVPLCNPILRTGDQGGQFIFITADATDIEPPDRKQIRPDTLPVVTSNVSGEKVRRDDDRTSDTLHSNPKAFTNSLGMEFVYIPPGTFKMGSPPEEKGRDEDERQYKVTLTKGFYMGKTEVTVGQYRRFVTATGYQTDSGAYVWNGSDWEAKAVYNWDYPGFKQQDTHPVTSVSWRDAQAFIQWLNSIEGKYYRLPTEAEWEYTARAGASTIRFWGIDPDKACQYANVADLTIQEMYPEEKIFNCKDGSVHTTPVARFAPNNFDLYDMIGNVWEWCQDGYGSYPQSSAADPKGTSSSLLRVVRGGSWLNGPQSSRSAYRRRGAKGDRSNVLGFRLAGDS